MIRNYGRLFSRRNKGNLKFKYDEYNVEQRTLQTLFAEAVKKYGYHYFAYLVIHFGLQLGQLLAYAIKNLGKPFEKTSNNNIIDV